MGEEQAPEVTTAPEAPYATIALARKRCAVVLAGRTRRMRGGDLLTDAGDVAVARQSPDCFELIDVDSQEQLDAVSAHIADARRELAARATALGFKLTPDL